VRRKEETGMKGKERGGMGRGYGGREVIRGKGLVGEEKTAEGRGGKGREGRKGKGREERKGSKGMRKGGQGRKGFILWGTKIANLTKF